MSYYRRSSGRVHDTEYKFHDFAGTIAPGVGTPVVISPALISQGVTSTQRIGMQLTLTSFQLRVFTTADVNTERGSLRLLLVVDRMPDQNAIGIAAILEDTTRPMTTPLKLENARRFQILRDQVFGWTAVTPGTILVNWYLPLGHTQRYLLAAGSTQSLASNNILLFALSGEPNASAPDVEFYSRVRFVD